MKRLLGKGLFGAVLTALFLMPFFSWISAEPVRYQDTEGLFTIRIPEGWTAEESNFMGKGVIMKQADREDGQGPLFHLVNEAAGVVTLDVYWHTHLGRLRYDLEKVKFQGLEDHEDQSPPYYDARYSFSEGEIRKRAIVRLVMIDQRFYLMTGAALEEEFEELEPLFLKTFRSLQVKGS